MRGSERRCEKGRLEGEGGEEGMRKLVSLLLSVLESSDQV